MFKVQNLGGRGVKMNVWQLGYWWFKMELGTVVLLSLSLSFSDAKNPNISMVKLKIV